MSREMIERLFREALYHLSLPKENTTSSLRALCRNFIANNKILEN